MFSRTILVPAVVLLAMTSPLRAQDTATVTDRQLRQRLDYALGDTRKSIQELTALLARMETMRTAVHARITRDSLAARVGTGTTRPTTPTSGGPKAPVVNGDPSPPAAGSALVYRHDFNDGTLGQFRQWGDHITNPASVVNDPTGSGRGKVVRVDYVHDPAKGGSHDVNHSMFYLPNPPGGDPTSLSWGERIYWRGDFWLPEFPGGRPARPASDMRKLIYPKFGDPNSNWSAFVVGLWGRADGSGMDMYLSSGRNENKGYEQKYGIAPVAWRTWNTLEVEFQANSRGKADGWIKIWLNGTLRYERTNVLLFSALPDPAGGERLFEWAIGNQEQWEPGDRMNDYRLWDNIEFRTARP